LSGGLIEGGTVVARHAPEADRVRANTWHEVNERLDAQAALRIQGAESDGTNLSQLIAQADREWDFERVLEAEASVMALLGLLLGVTAHRRFLFLPGFAAAMVFLHAMQGWYPLLPLFRRIGIRSQDEIDRERYALKALRGDFDEISAAGETNASRAAAAWRAVCA
jgi:hypothetical protein